LEPTKPEPPVISIFMGRYSRPDKPEITNYKHQITNKFKITISKF